MSIKIQPTFEGLCGTTMKQHILDVVRAEVAELKANTGLGPHAIEVQMVDIHTGRVAGDVFVTFEF